MRHHFVRGQKCRKLVLDSDMESHLPVNEGMQKPYKVHNEWKTLSDHLAPLYGLVRKWCGRKWDDLYSHIRESFDGRSISGQHIMEHLYQFCNTNVIWKNGELRVCDSGYYGNRDLKEAYNIEYFVHPDTNIITKNKYYKGYKQIRREQLAKEAAEKARHYRETPDGDVLARKDENSPWYFYKMADVPMTKEVMVEAGFVHLETGKPYYVKKHQVLPSGPLLDTDTVYDWLKEDYVHNSISRKLDYKYNIRTGRYENDSRTKRYAASKKTASRKELRKAGIRNEN